MGLPDDILAIPEQGDCKGLDGGGFLETEVFYRFCDRFWEGEVGKREDFHPRSPLPAAPAWYCTSLCLERVPGMEVKRGFINCIDPPPPVHIVLWGGARTRKSRGCHCQSGLPAGEKKESCSAGMPRYSSRAAGGAAIARTICRSQRTSAFRTGRVTMSPCCSW